TSIADQLLGLIETASKTITDLHLTVASASPSPAGAGWLSFDPPTVGGLEPPVTQAFTATVSVPLGTPAGTYTFDIEALADGGDVAPQLPTVTVPGERSLDAAGPYSGTTGVPVTLAGTGSDLDGYTIDWSVTAGPGECTFSDEHSLTSTVTCDTDGDYSLKL